MDLPAAFSEFLASIGCLENVIDDISNRTKTLENQMRLLDKFVARTIEETSRLETSIDSLNRRIERLESTSPIIGTGKI